MGIRPTLKRIRMQAAVACLICSAPVVMLVASSIYPSAGSGAGGGGGNFVGTFAALPSEVDQESYKTTDAPYSFVGSSGAWVPFVDGILAKLPPAQSNWTWFNQGFSTISTTHGGLLFTVPPQSGTNIVGQYFNTPQTAPYSVTAAISMYGNYNQTSGGICFYNSTSGKFVTLGFSGDLYAVNYLNSFNSFSSQPIAAQNMSPAGTNYQASKVYARITDDGTFFRFYGSADGVNYIESPNSPLTRNAFLTPDKFGVFSQNIAGDSTVQTTWILSLTFP
jgi:hypothetical protein